MYNMPSHPLDSTIARPEACRKGGPDFVGRQGGNESTPSGGQQGDQQGDSHPWTRFGRLFQRVAGAPRSVARLQRRRRFRCGQALLLGSGFA
jgi:hypothetical protein